ncbi:YeiH family protein [Planococcus sp. MB-3u-03]|uniref:YeiH family protein n=1 Tax=Planococcus sp. MB-3u-03 TaxID=2058136 RepID=UPI001E408FC5|nr:putative sulfate exporter family transporter [Planococcus sp. MB-3u-03]
MSQYTEIHRMVRLLPGLAICLVVIIVGIYGADAIGVALGAIGLLPEGGKSPVSGIFVAILLGILIRNTIGLQDIFIEGVGFAVKYALRIGIILLGLRLSLTEALTLGAWGLPLIIACISVGIGVTLFFTKQFGQSNRLGALIANGTGICGVTAIMATAPVIRAKENEISYAVANITIFGLLGMLFYPYLAHFFFADEPIKAGLFLGTAIHDTAQVTGAALMYEQMYGSTLALDVATITKLTRNLFIIVVIPLIAYLFFRSEGRVSGNMPKWYKLFPFFILGFLFLSFIRTMGDATLASGVKRSDFSVPTVGKISIALEFVRFDLYARDCHGRGRLIHELENISRHGLEAFYIGLIAALSVGAVSLLLISLFGDFVQLNS